MLNGFHGDQELSALSVSNPFYPLKSRCGIKQSEQRTGCPLGEQRTDCDALFLCSLFSVLCSLRLENDRNVRRLAGGLLPQHPGRLVMEDVERRLRGVARGYRRG